MTPPNPLTELAERVERLTGPCRETDLAIMQAISGHPWRWADSRTFELQTVSVNLGPQRSYPEVKARAHCKNKGWVTFEGRGGYWHLTDSGLCILKVSPHGQ